MHDAPALILASASAARQSMLRHAGLTFISDPARIDEAALKETLIRDTACAPPPDVALALASAKACDVSARHPGRFVIGSDQILALGERLLTKARSRDEARLALWVLRGKTHELHSAVSLVRDGTVLWSDVSTARMTVREFSDRWLEGYLDQAEDALLSCVGCYKLEGAGVQLFSQIEGDYFTILGMPLLSLLEALRLHMVIET